MTAASDRLLAAISERFEAARDPGQAVRMAAYMRDQFPFYGIPNPTRVTLEREAIAEAGAGELGARDLKAFALASWRRDEREHQYAAAKLLRRQSKVLEPDFLSTAQRLITTKSWWDTVDELADHVVGAIVRAHPSERNVMDRWLVDDDIWLARTAILHQLDWKADTDPDWLFAACLRRAGDTEFFIRKAIGWALRSYSYVDPAAVESFVTSHAAALSGLSRREAMKAIERTRRRASN
jgi:3-methyladenine DNA glycosylase AlkD